MSLNTVIVAAFSPTCSPSSCSGAVVSVPSLETAAYFHGLTTSSEITLWRSDGCWWCCSGRPVAWLSVRQPMAFQFQRVSLSWVALLRKYRHMRLLGLTGRGRQSVYTRSNLPSSIPFVPLEISSSFPALWIALSSVFFKLERLAFSVGADLLGRTDWGTCPQAESCKNQGSLPILFLFYQSWLPSDPSSALSDRCSVRLT